MCSCRTSGRAWRSGWGWGEDAVRAVAPEIVYVSISGFGETGPYAQKPVYDPLIQSVSGLASIQAGSDKERPAAGAHDRAGQADRVQCGPGDHRGAAARERTGKGQHIRLSMLDAIIAFLWASDMGSQTFVGADIPQQEAASFIDLIYETASGPISAAVQTNREWVALTRALDRPEWLEDERFLTPALRQRHINERLAMTQAVLRTRTAEEWLVRLTEAGGAVRAGADADADAVEPAGGGQRHRGGDRPSGGRAAAAGAPGGAVFRDAGGDPLGRGRTWRTYEGGAGANLATPRPISRRGRVGRGWRASLCGCAKGLVSGQAAVGLMDRFISTTKTPSTRSRGKCPISGDGCFVVSLW